MRRALVVALLLGGMTGVLVGCGGGSDSPDAATTTDFCTSFDALLKSASGATHSDLTAQVKAVKQGAADLEEVGAPDEMPAAAQRGFAVFLDAIKGIDDNAAQADLDSLGDDLSTQQQKDGEAFVAWAQSNCVSLPDAVTSPSLSVSPPPAPAS